MAPRCVRKLSFKNAILNRSENNLEDCLEALTLINSYNKMNLTKYVVLYPASLPTTASPVTQLECSVNTCLQMNPATLLVTESCSLEPCQ